MDLIIVDCQNDFVEGALSAENGVEIVDKICEYLNSNENLKVYYTSDYHPTNHMSFETEGGIWPSHCVAGSIGAEIHKKFYKTKYSPSLENVYYKGRNSSKEEYSAFDAENAYGKKLKEEVSDEIYVVGIASEYCVRETALAFKEFGKDVKVIKDLLGYIDRIEHEMNIEDLKIKNIEIV